VSAPLSAVPGVLRALGLPALAPAVLPQAEPLQVSLLRQEQQRVDEVRAAPEVEEPLPVFVACE
jgi:hypothetical protein